METIKIKINQDGVTCKEVNPLGKKPQKPMMEVQSMSHQRENRLKFNIFMEQWQQAESSLREFEIHSVEVLIGGIGDEEIKYSMDKNQWKFLNPPIIEGSIHDAVILENGKIRII